MEEFQDIYTQGYPIVEIKIMDMLTHQTRINIDFDPVVQTPEIYKDVAVWIKKRMEKEELCGEFYSKELVTIKSSADSLLNSIIICELSKIYKAVAIFDILIKEYVVITSKRSSIYEAGDII